MPFSIKQLAFIVAIAIIAIVATRRIPALAKVVG